MSAIQLAYSTSGLTGLDFTQAVAAIDRAGYAGVEVACHRRQFNVFELDDTELAAVCRQFDRLRVQPACVATASHFFDPQRPHEPSLLAVEPAARKRRIDLIRRGIRVARVLGAPLVTFGSGFRRREHVEHPDFDPAAALVESIHACLAELRDDDDITLVIEPEPGMQVETLAEGQALVAAVGSPRFGLHIDLCHAYCSERDYVAALASAAAQAKYLHVSDAAAGCNVRIVNDSAALVVPRTGATLLVHLPDTSSFLLLDREHPVLFRDGVLGRTQASRVDALLAAAGATGAVEMVDYRSLPVRSSPLDEEIFTWLISLPGLSYDVLERARPVARWLRSQPRAGRLERRLANTLTGIAHYHDIPGQGTLDFAASFSALARGGFAGYAAVELYHHVDDWHHALTATLAQLGPVVDRVNATAATPSEVTDG